MARKSRPRKKGTSSLRFLFIAVSTFALVFLLSPLLPKPQIPCANTISCEESLSLKVENDASGIFQNQEVAPPKISLSDDRLLADNVLGTSSSKGEKHIYVDLTKQMLYAYEGKDLFMQTPISSGKWGRTPTGEFDIWIKLRATRMSGGSGADYYDLPNVPYVMFFANSEVDRGRGFSLHGTYWHNNFGHAMSHGCVNMRIVDAQKLYNWASPETTGHTTYSDSENKGTKVTIYGKES